MTVLENEACQRTSIGKMKIGLTLIQSIFSKSFFTKFYTYLIGKQIIQKKNFGMSSHKGIIYDFECCRTYGGPCNPRYFSKTSRFPYIGSWCILSTVVTQYVMAAVCFQSMFNHFFGGFQTFVFLSGSPS